MSSYVPAALRRLVARRAGGFCEYCLIEEADSYFGCEVEHIISEKHGGKSISTNLAWSCALCNRAKGTDIGTLSLEGDELMRLYNPRTDRWTHHFRIVGPRIVGLTDIGRATARLLKFNDPARLEERQELITLRRFPSTGAKRKLRLK